jgi:UDP-glucose 4-epimerase
MTLWITGLPGFIGQAVARQAEIRGEKFCGIGVVGNATVPDFIAPYLLDEQIGPANLDRLATRFGRPGLVIHAAGSASVPDSLAHPDRDFESNVHCTQILCEFLRQRVPSARIVFLSSAAVYGRRAESPISEDVAEAPISPYGHNKLAAELIIANYARNFGLRAMIVRLFSVYGEGLRKQIFWDLCSRLAESGQASLSGFGSEQRDFIHVNDVARLLFLTANHTCELAPKLNGGVGVGIRMIDLAQNVSTAWREVTGRTAVIDFNGRTRQGDPASLVADQRKLSELGFAPSVEFAGGVLSYVRWFVDQRLGKR